MMVRALEDKRSMVMKFKFTADIEFEARDIDDAFACLSAYMEDLKNPFEAEWLTGSMHLVEAGCCEVPKVRPGIESCLLPPLRIGGVLVCRRWHDEAEKGT